jgi:hypothetical protein
MDLNRTGGVNYDPVVFLLFSRASGADGILSPPGFQFPVKELVASLKDLKESCINSPFLV